MLFFPFFLALAHSLIGHWDFFLRMLLNWRILLGFFSNLLQDMLCSMKFILILLILFANLSPEFCCKDFNTSTKSPLFQILAQDIKTNWPWEDRSIWRLTLSRTWLNFPTYSWDFHPKWTETLGYFLLIFIIYDSSR